MPHTRGSFGPLAQKYTIDDHGVTISRNVWLPFAVLGLMVPAGVLIYLAVAQRHADIALLSVGCAVALPSLFAVFYTPWLAPVLIRCSTEGLVWGKRTIPSSQVKDIRPISVMMRNRNRDAQQSWMLAVFLADDSKLTVSLGDHLVGTSTEKMATLVQGMKLALGVKDS